MPCSQQRYVCVMLSHDAFILMPTWFYIIPPPVFYATRLVGDVRYYNMLPPLLAHAMLRTTTV
jgi:hypothetical protein